VSFVFNVGCGNFADSTLLKRLNSGEEPATVAKEELPKWNKAGGVVAPGLVERRKQEIALFNTATSESALPACDDPTSSLPTPTSTKEPEPTEEPEHTKEPEQTRQPPSNTAAPSQVTTLSTAVSNSDVPAPTGELSSSDVVVVPTASYVSQPSGSAYTPVVPGPTKTNSGDSTGTNVPVKPTCTDGSCIPVTGGSATLYVNALAAAGAILAAVF
jgi:hypothetical protein